MPKNVTDKNVTDRAKKTLYVAGFNPKVTTKQLLYELFMQGGPVKEITLFDTHAYILFHHEESVPYCLALFNEIELHGQKLKLNPRHRTKKTYEYVNYLSSVRSKLMAEYRKIPPPDLPAKRISVRRNLETKTENKQTKHKKTKRSKRGGASNKSKASNRSRKGK